MNFLLVVMLGVPLGALAAPNPKCMTSPPPVSLCPDNYLPNYSSPTTLPPDVLNAVDEAKRAVDSERRKLTVWLDAQRAFRNASAALGNQAGGGADLEREFSNAREKYRKAAEDYAGAKVATDLATFKATKAVIAIYQLTPPKVDFNDTQAFTHRLSKWEPAFRRSEVSVDGKLRLRTPDELKAETMSLSGRAGAGTPAIGLEAARTTSYDGTIHLHGAAFDSPEALATSIFHETSHWVDLMGIGGQRKGTPLRPADSFRTERDAYRREAQFFSRLGNAAVSANRKDIAAQFEAQLAIAERQALTWKEIQMNPTYRGWLGVDAALRRVGFEDESEEGDEDASALAEIRRDSIAFRARREAESDRRIREVSQSAESEEDKRAVHLRMANAAIGCGLEPDDTWNVRYRYGANRFFAFQFKDEDTFRASLLLLHACYADKKAPPCVDAFDTMRTRWEEPGFREKLYLAQGSPDDAAACVADLVGNRKKPDSYKDLLSAKDRFWTEWWRGRNNGVPAETQRPPSTQEPRPPREKPDPVPPRNDLPWCMQAPGRRCID